MQQPCRQNKMRNSAKPEGELLKLVIGKTELTFIWNQILDALVDTYRTVLEVSVWALDDVSVLKEGGLRLYTRKKFFTMRVKRHWNRWHKEVVDAP